MPKYVVCCVCGLKIHIDEFGGIFGFNQKEFWFHEQCRLQALKMQKILMKGKNDKRAVSS